MEGFLEAACEEIDAAFFSSDTFHNPEVLAKIEEYLGRWTREAAAIKQSLPKRSETSGL